MTFLVLSGLLWGTGGLTGRLLAQHAHLSSGAVAAYRLSIGGILLVGYAAATRRRRPVGRAAWTRVAAVGLLSAGFQACYFAAVGLTSVSVATLVTIGTAPVLVIGFERATGRRRLDGQVVATIALAVSGLALLTGRLPHGISASAMAAGTGFAVLSASGFAAISLICARPVAGLDDLVMTGSAFTLGGLVLLPLAAVTSRVGFHPAATPLALLLALGLLPTAVAYACYFTGLRTAAASTGAVTALLEPLTGTVLAVAILGDRLTSFGIAGAFLLAGSVALEAWRFRACT